MFNRKTTKPISSPAEIGDRIRLNAQGITRSVEAIVRAAHPEMGRLSLLAHIGQMAPATLTELASAEQVSRPTMSESLRKLTASGLVDRLKNPNDRRSVHFVLTGKGAARLELAKRTHCEALEAALAEAGETNRAILEMALPILEEIARSLKHSQN